MKIASAFRYSEQLGPVKIVELSGLLYQDGLTPTEARPWLEPPGYDWPEVERLLFELFDHRDPVDKALPWHIIRWVERYRDAHARPTTLLFD